ncbi:MAG: DUF6876 family protein [Halothece sp.]
MITAEQLQTQLQQFTGTNFYYQHWFGLRYTDGIKFLANSAKCYWLIDAIASYQPQLQQIPMLRQFQLWVFVVGNNHEFIQPKPENQAVLTCWEDTPKLGIKPAITQQIPYTDFPLPKLYLYVESQVLLLPSEH